MTNNDVLCKLCNVLKECDRIEEEMCIGCAKGYDDLPVEGKQPWGPWFAIASKIEQIAAFLVDNGTDGYEKVELLCMLRIVRRRIWTFAIDDFRTSAVQQRSNEAKERVVKSLEEAINRKN